MLKLHKCQISGEGNDKSLLRTLSVYHRLPENWAHFQHSGTQPGGRAAISNKTNTMLQRKGSSGEFHSSNKMHGTRSDTNHLT